MSLLRFSWNRKDGNLYIPERNGGFVNKKSLDKKDPSGVLGWTGLISSRHDMADYLRLVKNAMFRGREISHVVLMIHGYNSRATAGPKYNPHFTYLHEQDLTSNRARRNGSFSWPQMLNVASDDTGSNVLGIACGWDSRPTWLNLIKGKNPYKIAYDRASKAAQEYARLVSVIHEELGVPVRIVCHSLGSKVAADMLHELSEKTGEQTAIDKVVFLGGALLACDIGDLVKANPGTSFYNIISREDDILNRLGEAFAPTPEEACGKYGNEVIGHNGLCGDLHDNWIDIVLDADDVQHWFQERDYDLTGDEYRSFADHNVYLTSRGNWRLYRNILSGENSLSIEELRAGFMPEYQFAGD